MSSTGFGKRRRARLPAAPDVRRTSQRRGRTLRLPWGWLVAALMAAAIPSTGLLLGQDHPQAPSLVLSNWVPPAKPSEPSAARKPFPGQGYEQKAARRMGPCGASRRNCVVDGDTIWGDGEKIRIVGIDTPEIKGRCRDERVRAQRAKDRLQRLVDGNRLQIERSGKDKYGRTLARVKAAGRDVGDVLVKENHARRYGGGRLSWC